jgi:hypothetical protein
MVIAVLMPRVKGVLEGGGGINSKELMPFGILLRQPVPSLPLPVGRLWRYMDTYKTGCAMRISLGINLLGLIPKRRVMNG